MEKNKTSLCHDNKSKQLTLLIRFIVEHPLRGSLQISTAKGIALYDLVPGARNFGASFR